MREVVALQPVSIVDHICAVTEEQLKQLVPPDDCHGSRRCEIAEIRGILAAVGEFTSKAGGSCSNTCRGLACLGVDCKLIGARGQDEWGAIYNSSMIRAGVDTAGVIVTKGSTGRSVILSCRGERTMRTCLNDAIPLPPSALQQADLAAEYVLISSYCFYGAGFNERAAELASLAGSKVLLDLASWEVVRRFHSNITQLLESGAVHGVFCNEDEAFELMGGRSAEGASVAAAQEFITRHCALSVVTLGERGCMVRTREGVSVAQKAISVGNVVDTTGAGDLFTSGFVYGLLRQYPLQRCCEIGCIAGAAVVQVIGAELPEDKWKWFHGKLHGDLAASVVRGSADVVHRELLAAYALVEKKGRGVVYYGSARLRDGSAYWDRAKCLGRDVAQLLGCTTWSGGGPGMMEAASRGAMEAGCPAAGIRIAREAGTTVLSSSYLPDDCQVMCRFLSSRKVALTDAGMRNTESDKTALIFLPGGLGTMDELFELLCLAQLKKLGSKLKVPIILCNYDGFYTGLMDYLVVCDENGVLKADEMDGLVLAHSNEGVLHYLAQFYDLATPVAESAATHIQSASQLIESAVSLHRRQRMTNGTSTHDGSKNAEGQSTQVHGPLDAKFAASPE